MKGKGLGLVRKYIYTNGIQYFAIVYKQLDQVVSDEVVTRMEAGQIPGLTVHPQFAAIEGDKDPADTRPFEIFLALQEFSCLRQHLSIQPQPPEKPLGLENYHEWFTPLVEKWLVISKAKALQRVRSAIQLDSLCEGEKIWPDYNTAPHFEAMLIDAVCSAAMHYSDLIHQALADSGYYEQSGPFRCSDDMCVTVNNLEYIRRSLSEFRPDGQLLHDNAEALLESSLTQLETRAERVLSKLAPLMQTALQKAIFHLAWSPDSLPANQASVPLMEYLDVHLSALNSALLTKNFNRSLTLIWNTVLSELSRQMDTDLDHDKPSTFHSRLHEALQLLVEFFHADGLGLSMESLHCDAFWRVEQRLQYHKTDTDRLIDMFYMQRLHEQYKAQLPGPFGHLSVRAYFNHDSLCVEVLHAKDIIPLDPNGFSDPFVIIELLPKKIFSHCTEQQTNVHKRTLNPVFDECFEFSVSLSQCQADGAMVVFTVMDHDVLTANDFGGEAFLALGTIPGVSDFSTSVDNFHGLKQVDLALMQQHDKNHPILQILETRLNDRVAQDFVRRQRARMASQIAYAKHTL
uniref:C2 domain-containing protein n=1 Tax=Megaselia scalaris TaxID=36166 RepID=T1GHI7_MEGSC